MTLQYKVFGAILAAIMLVVIYMTIVLQWSFDRGFLDYVNTVESAQLETIARELEVVYDDHQSWETLLATPHEIVRIIAGSYPEGQLKQRILRRLTTENGKIPEFPRGPLPDDAPVHFLKRVFLLDAKKQTLMGYHADRFRGELLELRHLNSVIGYLGVHPAKHLSHSHHLVFIKQQKTTLTLVAVAGLLIAAGLSLPISYMLIRPIRRLGAATRSLASGKYDTRVAVRSADEFGHLSADFNHLADILEKNRKARSQWIADISHELRTPVTILRGKIEALQDGVHEPTEETYSGLHREVIHLGMLVDDLYQLSLSDLGAMTYTKTEVEPCWALEQAVELLAPEMSMNQLILESQINLTGEETVMADNERLKQLFTNLLANSIRYTDGPGKILLTVEPDGQQIVYTIEDSAPGVTGDQLPQLFDRLYRGDRSRSRELGGAGLGLSICHNIVNGHDGTISASHSSLGGLQIAVNLPIARQT